MTLRVLVQVCKAKAAADGVPLRQILTGILLRQFEVAIESGQMVVSSVEAGGQTDFAAVPGLTPGRLASLAAAAIEWLDAQPDQENPGLPTTVRRYKFCFGRGLL